MAGDSGAGLKPWGWRKERNLCQRLGEPLRVLVVDDDRDGADTLGMVVEEFGCQVHVTYGGASGTRRCDPISARSDVDRPWQCLIWDGCRLVMQFRQIPAFAQTPIVAITGHADEGHKSLAMKGRVR